MPTTITLKNQTKRNKETQPQSWIWILDSDNGNGFPGISLPDLNLNHKFGSEMNHPI